MLKNNSILYQSFDFVLRDIIGVFLSFPLWWYGKGFLKSINIFLNILKSCERRLSLKIWLKNLFVPMYGMRDIFSFFISLVLRFVILIFRGFVFLAVFFLSLLGLLIYLILPVFSLYLILHNI